MIFLNGFWILAGIPTAQIARMIAQLKLKYFGDKVTKVPSLPFFFIKIIIDIKYLLITANSPNEII